MYGYKGINNLAGFICCFAIFAFMEKSVSAEFDDLKSLKNYMIGQLSRDVFDYILAVIALKQSSIPVFVINARNASFDPFHSVKMILTKI